MKVLYLGTPACSARCLEVILDSGIEVVGVLTQPDRPFGRRRSLRQPPVKALALEHALRVFQPEKASDSKLMKELARLKPDVTAVYAFGEFLTDEFLKIPGISTVNLHLSLLPKYRGAAPVQWAIVEGETKTGVTIFHIVRKMDAGDIIYQEALAISDEDTSETLTGKLTEIGSELMIRTIRDLERGTAPRTPQDHALATRARKLRKEDGLIDWSSTAACLHNLVRGMRPWPCAYSFWDAKDGKKMLKVMSVMPQSDGGGKPGEVFAKGSEMFVSTGEGGVKVVSVQIEGKRRMTGAEFLNGHRDIVGAVLRS